jgi:hypothetical protein
MYAHTLFLQMLALYCTMKFFGVNELILDLLGLFWKFFSQTNAFEARWLRSDISNTVMYVCTYIVSSNGDFILHNETL